MLKKRSHKAILACVLVVAVLAEMVIILHQQLLQV